MTRCTGCCAWIGGCRASGWLEEQGYVGGKTILDDYLREVRPLFLPRPRTFQRTSYRPGALCQFDLWEPIREIPVGSGQTRRGYVVVGCLPYSRAGAGTLVFSKEAPDLLYGIGRCLAQLGALPETLVWDREGALPHEAAEPHSGPEGATTDAESVALSVAQASIGIVSDRQFLGLIGKVLSGWVPHLPCQSQYNRRLRRLAPLLAAVQLRLAELLASGDLRLADGTLTGVANHAGCQQRSEFAGTAAYGYCAAKSQYVWGVRLVLITDRFGLPVGYTLVAANEKEYEPVRELTTAQAGCLLIADKGYWGREYAETLALQGVAIQTPDRVRTADNLAREKHLVGLRLAIESPISKLTCQMRLEQHLAQGLVQRIAQRLLAFTLGMSLNALSGRPRSALVAYAGR